MPPARPFAVLLLCLGLAATSLAARSGASATPADPAAAVVAEALEQVGERYAFGDEGPDSWDCSGLVFTLWQTVGGLADVPRVSRQQAAWAIPIPLEQVLPGDLVTFGSPVNHVGIVVARDGGRIRMVDAASSRRGVVLREAWDDPHRRYARVPRPTMPPVTPWQPATAPAAPTPVAPAPAPVAQPGLPALTQTSPSTKVAVAAARLARAAVGTQDPGDAAFLADVWERAGGPALPASRRALVRTGRVVAPADARVGDLVVYAAPAAHVGLYVGGGLMVDASRSQGKVVLRAVWAAPGLQLVRLPG